MVSIYKMSVKDCILFPMKKFIGLFTFLFVSQLTFAQLTPQTVSIPMRDGKFLAADLYLPNGVDSFPTILIQTPYNKNGFQTIGLPAQVGMDQPNSPYAFLIVDWRGFFGSIPAFDLNADRGEDGYDVVEWIAAQSWSDGKVGTWGPSALGNVQYSTARTRPPHLVCCVPEVASPQFAYAPYYPGGALRTEYVQTLGLLFGLSNLIASNPHYNLFWQLSESGTWHPDSVNVPFFVIGGWYDHNTDDCIWQWDQLRQLSDPPVRDQHRLLMGPWVHGGTGFANVGSSNQGELNFPLAKDWNDSLARMFFDFHMRGLPNGWDQTPKIQYYQIGEESWRNAATWVNEMYFPFYLREDSSISPFPGPTNASPHSFSYDPNDPSPTVGGRTLSLGLDQGPYDQGPVVESRGDVLIYEFDAAGIDLNVHGVVEIHLMVSSDRKDTDIAVRLTDVYPDGRSILVSDDIQRMRFRNGYTVNDTAMMTTGTVYPITIELENMAYTFRGGHKLRLVISGSNYPRYNRNMNTGEEMYPNNHVDTLVNPQIATSSIHFDNNGSYLNLPLRGYIQPGIGAAVEPLPVEVYPNPAANFVQVDLPQVGGPWEMQLSDGLGRVVAQWSLHGSQRIELPAVPDGVFFWTVSNGELQRSGKLMRRK